MVMHYLARRALRRRVFAAACVGVLTHPHRLFSRAGRRRVADDFRYAFTEGSGSGLLVEPRDGSNEIG